MSGIVEGGCTRAGRGWPSSAPPEASERRLLCPDSGELGLEDAVGKIGDAVLLCPHCRTPQQADVATGIVRDHYLYRARRTR